MKLDKPLRLSFTDETQADASHNDLDCGRSDDTSDALQKKVRVLEDKLRSKDRLLEDKRRELRALMVEIEWLKGIGNELRGRQKMLEEELRKAEFQIQLAGELIPKIHE